MTNEHRGGGGGVLTVHLQDLLQAGEDGGQLWAGEDLLPLQGLGEDRLEHRQHAVVCMLSRIQL